MINGKIGQVNEIFAQLWKKNIYNAVVLYAEKSSVKMFTFEPFNEGKCEDIKTVEITGSGLDIFPEKLKNLRKCEIKVSALEVDPVVRKDELNGVVGRDIDLVSKSVKFSREKSFLYDNGTATGILKDLMDRKRDIVVGDLYLKLMRLAFFDASKSYFNSKLGFVVPPERKLEPIEKLYKPLSSLVWLGLAAFVVVGVCASLLLKAKFKQNFSYLNVISALFGVSLAKLPKNLSTRLVFMAFVLSCL